MVVVNTKPGLDSQSESDLYNVDVCLCTWPTESRFTQIVSLFEELKNFYTKL